jgi:hypothetical protein
LSFNCPGLVAFDPNDEGVIRHPVVKFAFAWVGEGVSLAASDTAKLYPKFVGKQANRGCGAM